MRSDSPKNTHKHVAPRNTLRIPGKRSHRLALFGGAFLAVAGLVAGGGFAVQSAVATQERVSATTALAESTGLDHAQLGAYAGIAKAHTGNAASIVLVRANLVIAATKGKVDASGLSQVASSLADYKILPLDKVVSLTAQTKAATASVTAAAAAVAARAAAATRAAALAASNTPAGAQATARAMALSRYGWGSDQFSCLAQLWQKESGWNYKAYNPSGATGIPQALPGSKMASAGTDWATNATTQIAWGLEYISASSYGTPCAAWSHSQAFNWY
jgi:hypothetical protein